MMLKSKGGMREGCHERVSLKGMGAREMIMILGPKGLNPIRQDSAFSFECLFAFTFISDLLCFLFRS